MPDLAMFSLSQEHKMIRDAARDFAQKEIVPIAAEFDESGEFPHGAFCVSLPQSVGGTCSLNMGHISIHCILP